VIDLIYIGLMVLFFALSMGYAVFCEKL